MTRLDLHIDHLVVPNQGFDVAAFTEALRGQIAAQWSPVDSSSSFGTIRAGHVASADPASVASAVHRSLRETFQ